MKYLFIFFSLFLMSCHPTFKREKAQELLERRYQKVELTDYYEYPNCSTAHTWATAWRAQDEKGRPVSGVLCCDSKFDCLVFQQVVISLDH